jgi:hypothetical protein
MSIVKRPLSSNSSPTSVEIPALAVAIRTIRGGAATETHPRDVVDMQNGAVLTQFDEHVVLVRDCVLAATALVAH